MDELPEIFYGGGERQFSQPAVISQRNVLAQLLHLTASLRGGVSSHAYFFVSNKYAKLVMIQTFGSEKNRQERKGRKSKNVTFKGN